MSSEKQNLNLKTGAMSSNSQSYLIWNKARSRRSCASSKPPPHHARYAHGGFARRSPPPASRRPTSGKGREARMPPRWRPRRLGRANSKAARADDAVSESSTLAATLSTMSSNVPAEPSQSQGSAVHAGEVSETLSVDASSKPAEDKAETAKPCCPAGVGQFDDTALPMTKLAGHTACDSGLVVSDAEVKLQESSAASNVTVVVELTPSVGESSNVHAAAVYSHAKKQFVSADTGSMPTGTDGRLPHVFLWVKTTAYRHYSAAHGLTWSGAVVCKLTVESRPTEDTSAEVESFPAHHAAFIDDVQTLRQATEGWTSADWATLDPCGNTVLHVAALRGSARSLRYALDAGADLETKNGAGWTALEEAVDNRCRLAARTLFDARQAKNAARSTKATLRTQAIEALGSMPDFSMRINWKLGSAVFGLLITKYLPSDMYTVWKRGNKLRVDGSLMGVGVPDKGIMPKWKRGHFSILLTEPEEGGPLRLVFVNRVKQRYARLGKVAKHVSAELTAQRKRVRCVLTLSLSKGAVSCAIATTTEPTQREKEAAAERAFEAVYTPSTYGSSFTRSEMLPDGATFKPLLDWFGRPSQERIAGVSTSVYEATTRLRAIETFKRNSYALGGTFSGYLAKREYSAKNEVMTQLLQLPVSFNDLMRSVGAREQKQDEGSKLRAKVWLAKGFALNVSHMQLILNLIAMANQHAAKAAVVLQKWEQRDVFPMKVYMPLLLSLYAQLSCADFKPGCNKVAPDWFSVPATCSESSPREVMEQIAKSALGGPDASRSTSATEEPVDNLFGDFAIM